MPSVWPVRTSVPPSAARSGKMWPGRARSAGCASGLTAARIVFARSFAEIPVVTPSAASIDTVKLVPNRERFCETIIGRSSWSQISLSSARQISPQASRDICAISSGVANSAAKQRSPSFSRSGSSTSTIGRPAFSSSSSSGMGANVSLTPAT